jgi:hypothetical protein
MAKDHQPFAMSSGSKTKPPDRKVVDHLLANDYVIWAGENSADAPLPYQPNASKGPPVVAQHSGVDWQARSVDWLFGSAHIARCLAKKDGERDVWKRRELCEEGDAIWPKI